MKSFKKVALVFAASFFVLNVTAQVTTDIVDVAIGSEAHTTLVAAVKSADLVATMRGKGPFTLFAPTNDAFDRLPSGSVETLLKPASKARLSGILTYHVVAGKLDAAAVIKAIKKGGGKASFNTVAGEQLTASIVDGKVVLTDAKGGKANVTATDLKATNGIVHVIDAVLQPM